MSNYKIKIKINIEKTDHPLSEAVNQVYRFWPVLTKADNHGMQVQEKA